MDWGRRTDPFGKGRPSREKAMKKVVIRQCPS